MTEDRKRFWDVILGVVAPILTVVGIVIGVAQYNDGENNRREADQKSREAQVNLEIKKDELEFKRKLWLERLDTYRTAAKTAGQIASAPAGPARQQAIRDFEGAYWGAMVMVEDPKVSDAMQALHYELEQAAPDHDRVAKRVFNLANELRRSLADGQPPALARP